MSEPSNTKEPPDDGLDQCPVDDLPLFVCKHCGHEWDDEHRYYCGCGGPYRIPNPEIDKAQLEC